MNDVEKLLLDPVYFGKVTVMRLSQALEQFKEWRGFKVAGQTVIRYDSVLRIFCLCMGDPEVNRISIQHVLHYMKELERLGWKRNGIVIVALALRKFFEFCNLQGMKCLNESLIPLPRKEFNIPRVANEADFQKLVKAIPRDDNPNNIRNLALIHIIWDSWARSGEIVSLNEDDLVFKDDMSGSALIKTEKSRGRRPVREIFWTATTGKYIKHWLETKHEMERKGSFEESEALFVSIRKCGAYDVRGCRMTNRGVNEVFRLFSNRAKLPTMFNPHSARHYGGRKIVKQGGSSADVSNLLGHSHMDSSMIYTMMWGNDLRERYDKFRTEKETDLKKVTGEEALSAFLKFIQDGGGNFVGDLARHASVNTHGGGKYVRA